MGIKLKKAEPTSFIFNSSFKTYWILHEHTQDMDSELEPLEELWIDTNYSASKISQVVPRHQACVSLQ